MRVSFLAAVVISILSSGAAFADNLCLPTRPPGAQTFPVTGTIYSYLCGMHSCYAETQQHDGSIYGMFLAKTRTINGVVVTCGGAPFPGDAVAAPPGACDDWPPTVILRSTRVEFTVWSATCYGRRVYATDTITTYAGPELKPPLFAREKMRSKS
jgi:hypothetical protein